jgi:hypothetical protein
MAVVESPHQLQELERLDEILLQELRQVDEMLLEELERIDEMFLGRTRSRSRRPRTRRQR